MVHKIKLEIFEGPLDLLLYLIKKDDIDIRDIPIASITEQYMAYIEMMKILDLDIVGDFLVMAATLIQIKSKMLLPPDPTEESAPAEDPREELANRLLEYQRFQEIAEELRAKEKQRRDLFPRNIDEQAINQLREESKEIYFETSLFDLINALYDALKKTPQEIIHEITKEEFTVEQKIHEILHAMLEQSSLKLSELFSRARSRVEIIVTFLAILELIRLREIKVLQKSAFGEIEVFRNKDNMLPVSLEPIEVQEKEEAGPAHG
ncbi:MAG: segregation/condensation protein A [Candidatus Omnitrophota bacterium]|nr:segregation/condensation protein A [Candidatus Omnitrophota bacterium]